MNYLTESLYKKMQLFQLPLEDGMTLLDLEEAFGIEIDEFLLQELLARDEWYDKYLPEPLHSRLFHASGELSFREVDDTLLQQILVYRRMIEQEWFRAMAKVRQEKQQLWKTAAPEFRKLLEMDLTDSEIRRISGIDSKEVQIELYPQWDLGQIITLHFTQVKDSWMGRFHSEDANWWLADEISADEQQRQGRSMLHVLFGNADYVGQIQFSFADVQITERKDPLEF